MKRCIVLLLLLSVLLAVPAMAAGESSPEDTAVTVYAIDTPPDDRDAVQLPELLVDLFGSYEPKTYTVTEYLPDGETVISQQYVPGLAGMDMEWLASVGLFALVIYCLLKLVGGVLKL